MKLVECVSNFSEGRRKEVVDKIVEAVGSAGVELLDVEMNGTHNRCVISFIGGIGEVGEAAFRGAKRATELIDLNGHEGAHPRIGACDVIPFIPITADIEDCKALAESVGKRIASELEVPVYFYEESARSEVRRKLENIRKGNFEWLRDHFSERPPDVGSAMHPTAGATVLGARKPLIAYNAYLNRADEKMGKRIAKSIRESGGGLKNVKSIGFVDGDRTQISMNLVDLKATPIYRVFALLRAEAQRYGAMVEEGEIVGLIPEKALTDSALYYLQLNSLKEEQILERRLENTNLFALKKLHEFADMLASKNPTPGGGTVSAIVGVFSCALAEKVCALSDLEEEREKLKGLREEFFFLAQEDSATFKGVMKAYRVPKDVEGRKEGIEEALKGATLVPLRTLERCTEALEIEKKVLEMGKKNALSDAQSAVELAMSAARCARYNVEINLESIKDGEFKKRIEENLKTFGTEMM